MNTNPMVATTRVGLVLANRPITRAALLAIALAAAGGGIAHADPAGAASDLSAIAGHGVGKVIVSPDSKYPDTFDARVKVNIHDAAPNTTFAITRAIDFTADGDCTNAQFDTVAYLTTSAGGAGAVEFERGPSVLPTDAFDLHVRVNGGDGTIFESDCMTVHVK